MKTILGFLVGAVLASGVTYYMVQRHAGSATSVVAAAPATQPVVVDPGPRPVPAANPVGVATSLESVPARKMMVAPVVKANDARLGESPRAEARPIIEPPAAPDPVTIASVPSQPPVAQQSLPPAAGVTAPLTPEVRQEAPPPPPPAPVARSITIPAGTVIPVRIAESLSSDRNSSGDNFRATLDQPLVVDGLVIAERGARADGRVVEADRAGRVKGVSQLVVELVGLLTADGQRLTIRTEAYSRQGQSSRKEDAMKVGAGSAIGAALGAIIGGGKGAAIGAGAGGAAGTGDVLMTRGKPVNFPVETRISFQLREPVPVTEKLH